MLESDIRSAGYDHQDYLRDIRFNLPHGRIMAVIGPNGSGKTTLIRALSGVLPHVEGSVSINGTDLLAAGEQERARLLAVVPQSTHIPPAFSVEEVVLLGRSPHLNWLGNTSRHDTDIAEEAMRRTDILGLRNRLCGELSSGERQRVILARALAQDTPVLLMDEPTSHLDLRYQVEILSLARELALEGDKTMLAAMHDLNLAALFSDEVLAMKDGQAVASGLTDEILTAEKIEEIYGLPVAVLDAPGGGQRVIIPRIPPGPVRTAGLL